MFFPEKIGSIQSTDLVLEIGPGSNPHPRSNVLLEKIFTDEEEFRLQRGNTDKLVTDKKTIYYEGDVFPFKDKEFDYVICSHVLEHVEDPAFFLSEMYRVAKKGYLEFPTSYYDFVYNIPVHPILLLYKNGVIHWLPKSEAHFEAIRPFQKFLFETLMKEHFGLVNSLREYFVQGMEWEQEIPCQKAKGIADICFDEATLADIKINEVQASGIGLRAELKRKFGKLFNYKP